ncbi:DUF3013 family protein [Streptococcus mutans]|uniref:DUF3013 family protein n=1 Tax=Streptococcus mutans TaxID=1309 RepID=UPI0002B5CAF6|nr:DUF3013 family protein [Streptococcus mutans]EMB64260.1 hypothetical protein SMU26_09097 [Streptococcus mutans 3SN1]EMC20296.1 hypothetical protein SMU80_07193 [Streptococcus mutans SF1]EMC42634.1 hypothetical protein SMU97_06096 [Streptococcus mutans SM4]EMC47532.1 hypothetical protein SMU102_09321 [Streptococcus mutans S1B]EMC58583.1 hypothetical protein SMU108_02869 [Streptococcus mutans M230]
MPKYGFLSVLKEEMDKHFHYDYALDWNKKNHAVELSFIIEAQNAAGVETVDDTGQVVSEDLALEEFVLFYNSSKSRFKQEDYLVALPFEAKKGYSREFLAYFADFLNEGADQGLSDLMDFLADEEAVEFAMVWNEEAFENGRAGLEETEFYPYPRY